MMRRYLAYFAVCALCAAPAAALNLPQRKAGLWELKMEFGSRNLPAQVMRQCTNAATDRLMNLNFGGSNEQACTKQDVRKNGDTITVDSLCKFSEMTITSHAVITGSFDSAYRVDVTQTRRGGPPMPGVAPGAPTHMTITGKWLGPCAPGQRPGDVITANRMKMNVLDLQRMRGAPAQK